MIKHIDINLLYKNSNDISINNLITFYKNDNKNENEFNDSDSNSNNNINNTQIIFSKEFPEIKNKILEEKHDKEIFNKKKDKFFLIQNIFKNYINLILHNRKNEIIPDNISYWLFIIVYNM
jgi:hypothetical protein